MKMLSQIQQELAAGQFDFSRHAFRRVVERNISEQEIREVAQKPRSLRIIPGTNIHRAVCCWATPALDGRCIFKYPLLCRTRRRSLQFISLTQTNGLKTGNGGSHV
jgi:hypothetical protein